MKTRLVWALLLAIGLSGRLAAGELLVALDPGTARLAKSDLELRSQQVSVRLAIARDEREAGQDSAWADIEAEFLLRNSTGCLRDVTLAVPVWRALSQFDPDGPLNSMLPTDRPLEQIAVRANDQLLPTDVIPLEVDGAKQEGIRFRLSVAPRSEARVVARWRQPMANGIASCCLAPERSVIASKWYGQYETGVETWLTLLFPDTGCWSGQPETCVALASAEFEQALIEHGVYGATRSGGPPLVSRHLAPDKWTAGKEGSDLILAEAPGKQLTVRHGFATLPTTAGAIAAQLGQWERLGEEFDGAPFPAPTREETVAVLRALIQATRGRLPRDAELRRFVENQRWFGRVLPRQLEQIEWDAIERQLDRK